MTFKEVVKKYLEKSGVDAETASSSEIARGACEMAGVEYNDTKRRQVAKFRSKGLIEECNKVGIDVGSVTNFWHKGKNYSIHAKNKASTEDEVRKIVEELKEDLGSLLPLKQPVIRDYSNLLILPIPDLHIGKKPFGGSVKDHLEARLRTAVSDLLHKASGMTYGKIIIPLLGDIFNSDTNYPFPATTGGTPQENELSYSEMLREARKMIVEVIYNASEIAPVEVISIQGNHDHQTMLAFGEILDAVFYTHPNVEINNEAVSRKYVRWGKNLIGMDHGDKIKPNALPLLLAQENKVAWAETETRFWIRGHLHHSISLTTRHGGNYEGVQVEYLETLAADDMWHHSKGYVTSSRGMSAFAFDDRGLVARFYHKSE